MKTPSSYLYDLVHSLSKSEKRYIKIQAGSDDKDYIQLMNALLIQKTFDEDQLIRSNKDAKFAKHLSTTKKYLYNFILKSLINFGNKEAEDKVLEKIAAAKVLIKRNLSQQALKELKQGEKIAEKHDFFDLQLQMITLKKRILGKTLDEKIHVQLFKEEADCLEKKQEFNEYWYLDTQLGMFHFRFKNPMAEEHKGILQKITGNEKFQKLDPAATFSSKFVFYALHARHQSILKNYEEAEGYYKKGLQLLEANPHFFQLHIESYIYLLSRLLWTYIFLGKLDEFEATLPRLVDATERPGIKFNKKSRKYLYAKWVAFGNWSGLKVVYLLNQDDESRYERLLDVIPEIQNGLKQYREYLVPSDQNVFSYYIALAYFQNGWYIQAFDWNNKILNNTNDSKTLNRLFYTAKVLDLLIHFELGHHMLLESLLSATKKYLKSRRPFSATEKVLFRFLNKSIKALDEAERKEIAGMFKNDLEELRAQNSPRKFRSTLELSPRDLLHWLGNRASENQATE